MSTIEVKKTDQYLRQDYTPGIKNGEIKNLDNFFIRINLKIPLFIIKESICDNFNKPEINSKRFDEI